ncbi:MAG: DUF4124 domain-containing protein [Thermochromatium sp.]
MFRLHLATLARVLILVGLLSSGALSQQLYRWVDDQGEVHYSDQVPPTHADKARVRLSPQGIAIETQPGAPTGEELERLRELERRKAEEERQHAERQARDKQLLHLYSTVDDLELARDGQLAAIEADIQSKRDDMRDEIQTLITLYTERQDLQRQDKVVPLALTHRIDTAMANIRQGYGLIIADEFRKQDIRDRFKDDIARFRQLKHLPEPISAADAVESGAPRADLLPCREQSQCHAYWERAVRYVRAHSDREGEVIGPGLMIAFQRDEQEVRTLTLVWIQEDVDQPVWIYLDIQCQQRLTASLICIDPNVPRVREGFRTAVMVD